MTYHAGVQGFGWDSEPRVTCDGCGLFIRVNSPPPAWFLNGKAPKGWAKGTKPDGSRLDKCPGCRQGGKA